MPKNLFVSEDSSLAVTYKLDGSNYKSVNSEDDIEAIYINQEDCQSGTSISVSLTLNEMTIQDLESGGG